MEPIFPFGWAFTAVLGRVFEVFINPIFWVVIALVAFQYRRIAAMRNTFLGSGSSSVIGETLQSTAFGLIGGVVGSYLIVLTGLSIAWTDIMYLLPVAILLMLIDARFLCFAYSGGLLATLHLLTGFPDIGVAQVMALVAMLHFVESILILISGHIGAVPAYIRLPRGRVVGGFALQKFWPLPLIILSIVSGVEVLPGAVEMPGWWPLIEPAGGIDAETVVFVMLPVVAALGYGDLAVARTPRQKTRASALALGAYSIVLYLLALLASLNPVFAWAAALFSPLGHELTIHLSRHREFNEKPVFVPRVDGLLVLGVRQDSPAWRAGIRSGDLLREINGRPVRFKAELQAAVLQEGVQELGFVKDDRRYYRELVHVPPGGTLGIMPVPEGGEIHYVEMKPSLVSRWLRGKVDKKM